MFKPQSNAVQRHLASRVMLHQSRPVLCCVRNMVAESRGRGADLELGCRFQSGVLCGADLRQGGASGRSVRAEHRADVDAAAPPLQRRQQDQAHDLQAASTALGGASRIAFQGLQLRTSLGEPCLPAGPRQKGSWQSTVLPRQDGCPCAASCLASAVGRRLPPAAHCQKAAAPGPWATGPAAGSCPP